MRMPVLCAMHWKVVFVLMVFVMGMLMLMFQGIMDVIMGMMFGQVQPRSPSHQ